MTGEDSLSFVHTAESTRHGGTTLGSQIAINGVLLDRLLVTLNFEDGAAPPDTLDMMSTPLDPDLPIDQRAAFLKALSGGEWSADDLQHGRVPIAFCAQCLDSSCGMMWSVGLTMSPSTVVWKGIGWENETFRPVVPQRRPFCRRAVARGEFAGWEPAPFTPEVNFTFARDEYDAVILRETQHQTGYHGPS